VIGCGSGGNDSGGLGTGGTGGGGTSVLGTGILGTVGYAAGTQTHALPHTGMDLRFPTLFGLLLLLVGAGFMKLSGSRKPSEDDPPLPPIAGGSTTGERHFNARRGGILFMVIGGLLVSMVFRSPLVRRKRTTPRV
jgi:LPXTG-motif cell wall-anchored protein